MRAFLAIDLPEQGKKIVAQLQQPLRKLSGVKLTRPEQCHLTLKFLGEIDEPQAKSLRLALREIRQPPFRLSLTRLGAFPDTRRPRVIWLGVSDSTQLEALAQSVDRATSAIAQDKPFAAHLTLARIKDARGRLEPEVLGTLAPPYAFDVTEFVLYKSSLTHQGAVHEILERFALPA